MHFANDSITLGLYKYLPFSACRRPSVNRCLTTVFGTLIYVNANARMKLIAPLDSNSIHILAGIHLSLLSNAFLNWFCFHQLLSASMNHWEEV